MRITTDDLKTANPSITQIGIDSGQKDKASFFYIINKSKNNISTLKKVKKVLKKTIKETEKLIKRIDKSIAHQQLLADLKRKGF